MNKSSKAVGVIIDAIISLGGKKSDFNLVAFNQKLANKIAGLIVECAKSNSRLAVNYSWPLNKMIERGKYDHVNSNITAANFPVQGKGRKVINITLRHLNCYFKSGDEIIAALAKGMPGYRPARIEELLALGAAQPDLQRQFPIAALGSIWHHDGRHHFAYLDGHDAGRHLNLSWLEGGLSGFWRFAVVHEAILP